MGILGSIIGGIAGALLGDHVGIAGFGNAVNGSIPGAITGIVVGGLLEDKISNKNAPIFPVKGAPAPNVTIKTRQMENEIFEKIYQMRMSRGLSIPCIDDSLSIIARYKSFDMANLGKLEVTGGTYGDLANMLNGFGYDFENAVIGMGDEYYGDDSRLLNWARSAQVSRLLFSDDFKKIGVGYVEHNGYFSVILAN